MLRRSFFMRKEFWEYDPTPEHKSLVITMYRNVLKGLLNYKSVRRRSMIAYARMTFRRRAQATEKLLIDECIEEARRSIYILDKHHRLTLTREYEFDSMAMPKDTGQDVKTFMEEVYDPEISRQQFANVTDVTPGNEQYHQRSKAEANKDKTAGAGPGGVGHSNFRMAKSQGDFKNMIKEEDMVFRPPPPPMGQKR